MGAHLGEIGIKNARNTFSSGTAALLRTAVSGRLEFETLMEDMKQFAVEEIPMARWSKGQWWPDFWQAPPLAKNLADA